MNKLKQTIRQKLAELLIKAAKLLDEPHFNSSMCLIFNGMASMVAIVFIVMFIIGNKTPLLLLGIIGCVTMTLANITDLFPSWLRGIARSVGKRNN